MLSGFSPVSYPVTSTAAQGRNGVNAWSDAQCSDYAKRKPGRWLPQCDRFFRTVGMN